LYSAYKGDGALDAARKATRMLANKMIDAGLPSCRWAAGGVIAGDIVFMEPVSVLKQRICFKWIKPLKRNLCFKMFA
jgi:hypothetical protein